MVWLAELSAYAQGVDGFGGTTGGGVEAAAACVTVIVWPATVMAPIRASPAFCPTVKVAVPLPAVADCFVIPIQATLLAAVHVHAAALAVTVTVSGPPAAETVGSGEATVNRQTPGSCATTTCASLTSTIARRADGSAFAAARYATLPLPCPAASDVSVIHEAPLDAVHVQSRVVSIVMVPVAPSAGTDASELVADTWHFGVVGPVTAIDDEPHADAMSATAIETSGARRVMTCGRVLIRDHAALQIDCLTCRQC
jgi:hypothetical protein